MRLWGRPDFNCLFGLWLESISHLGKQWLVWGLGAPDAGDRSLRRGGGEKGSEPGRAAGEPANCPVRLGRCSSLESQHEAGRWVNQLGDSACCSQEQSKETPSPGFGTRASMHCYSFVQVQWGSGGHLGSRMKNQGRCP